GAPAASRQRVRRSGRQDRMNTATQSLFLPPSSKSGVGPAQNRWRRAILETFAALAALSQEMSFIEHMEELRRRLIWTVLFLAVAFAVCWRFAGDLYGLASAPIRA